jgi:hypothetical protein
MSVGSRASLGGGDSLELPADNDTVGAGGFSLDTLSPAPAYSSLKSSIIGDIAPELTPSRPTFSFSSWLL